MSEALRMDRRGLLGAGLAAASVGSPAPARAEEPVTWRNKRAGMAYRRLGRTGLMVSEVVCGGDPVTLENYRHLEQAFEMGLNYLDMAPQYNGGNCERAYGKLLAGPIPRDQIILTTKISGFTQRREQMYREIFELLPEGKKAALVKRSHDLRAERGVDRPGYYLTYFPNQQAQLDPAYLRVAMMEEYAHRVEGSDALRKYIEESLNGSLQRLGTDHVDLVMCPHGANTPEELRCVEIVEIFQKLRRAGKVRFLGVTAHNDPAGILRTAADLGHYDAVMMAYNVVNGGYLEEPIRQAASKGVGVIAMKVAHAVATHHKALQPVPAWRVEMVDRIVPGDLKPPLKAYLWALQNPNITAVISNLWDAQYVRENLALAGKRVELRPA